MTDAPRCRYNLDSRCPTDGLLDLIADERERQRAKWGDQSHLPDGTGGAYRETLRGAAQTDCDHAMEAGRVTWRHILAEEVAEALAETSPARLRVELVQVAAVCVQWLEALDRRQCDAARALFGDQTCPACGMEHPSQPCPQPDLFGGSDA